MTDSTSAPTDRLVFNGLDGATGDYSAPPIALSALVAGLRGRARRDGGREMGAIFGVDPADLAQAGWGVIFPRDGDPAVERALAPLLALRRGQAGAMRERRFRIFSGEDGLLPDESKGDFLHRHGAGLGAADPDKMPYYLLLAGGPAEMPYEFQYQLDLQYAVGRLAFDTPWDYARYAETVVAAETGRLVRPRRASFLAAVNGADPATEWSGRYFVDPMAQALASAPQAAGWEVTRHVGDAGAGRDGFASHLGGGDTPALLFTAGHGVSWSPADPWQRSHQGALVTQDWPGRTAWQGPLSPDHLFAAPDVAPDADLAGLVAFFFACYGAGTPAVDDFFRTLGERPKKLAETPLVARLPQRLLAHPRGGALAVIGHVDRAWTSSFLWGSQVHRTVFESTLAALLAGVPVGMAMEAFGARHADLAQEVVRIYNARNRGDELSDLTDAELVELWKAHHDSRNYVVLGDPAVRLVPAPVDGRSEHA